MKRVHPFVLFIVLVLMIMALAPSVMAQSSQSRVVTPNSVYNGRTYAQLQAAWWQWAFSLPVAANPLFDTATCDTGQAGDVWFIGGKFCQTGQLCPPTAVRTCTIPRTKAVFFPIGNVEDSIPEEPNFGCGNNLPPLKSGTVAEMRACVNGFVSNFTTIAAWLDGTPIATTQKNFRSQSIQFDITLPEDNLLNGIGEGPVAAGTYSPVVDEGYYVLLSPLIPGPHTLRIIAYYNGALSQDITYTLNVN